jgi:hypothetical protein
MQLKYLGFVLGLLISVLPLCNANDDVTYFDTNTYIMLYFEGADGGTSSPNRAQFGGTGSAGLGLGNIDTGQSKFGGTSLQCGGGVPTPWAITADPLIGWSTFTIDLWVRFSTVATAGLGGIISSASDYWSLGYDSGGTLEFDYQVAGVSEILISNPWVPSADTWYHIALVRNSSDWYMFIDGGQIGSTATDSSSIADTGAGGVRPCTGRVNDTTTNAVVGWVDEYRITQTALWTSNFTPPNSQYVTDGKRML